MRRLNKIILFAAAIILSAACNKETVTPVADTITITVHSDDALTSKTSLGPSNKIIWSTSDHISLFYKGSSDYQMADFACTSVSNEGRLAVFTGTSKAEGASSYVALYPYDEEAECSNKGKVGTTLIGAQTAVAGSFDPKAAIAVARGTDKDNLFFSNQTAILGVKPQESGITSITLIGSSPMTGELEFKADGTVVNGRMSRSVRISGAMNSGTQYYASVMPGSHTGLKIVLGREDGKYASFSGGAMTLERNGLYSFFDKSVSNWKTSEKLYINEVKCGPDGKGVNEKKIEIYNPNDKPVSLHGWTIVKDDSRLYAFSEGSSIAAHGYYVITCRQDVEDAGSATFGLSGDNGFNLKLCHGGVIDELDNLNPVRVIVDGYTYGRKTDGGEPWVIFSEGTIGSDNSKGTEYEPQPTSTGIVLNEIDAANGWVELRNTTASPVSLENFKAYLNEQHKPAWTGTASDVVAANGYFTFNLELSARKNLKLVVEDAVADIVGTFTRGSKGAGWDEVSLPENTTWSFSLVSGQWVYALPTKNAANGQKTADIEQGSKLVLNELNGSYSGGKDYIEIYNPGVSTEYLDDFKIRRYRLKDGADDDQTLWKGTSAVSLAAGAYLTLYYEGDLDDNKTFPYRLQRDFSAKKNTYIWLQDDQENVLDVFQRGVKSSGWNYINMQKVESATGVAYSYSRVGGNWVYANPTPGAVNGAKVGDIDQTMCPVVMNEINMPGNWIELYNMGDTQVSLVGLQLRWSRVKSGKADNQTIWEVKDTAPIQLAAGAYLAVTFDKISLANFTNKNVHIRLRSTQTDFMDENIVWDDFKRGKEGTNWTTVTLSSTISTSIIRVTDGGGDWYLGNASKNATNGTDKSGGLCPEVDQ